MSEHKVEVSWERTTEDFLSSTYPREHQWTFAGGQVVRASAAPDYRGAPDCVDPEEALVAAVSSCHMLTFLAVAAQRRLTVDAYSDEAIGYLEKNERAQMAITRVELRPRITFAKGITVTEEQRESLHEVAHRNCFIANSIKAEVRVLEPADTGGGDV